jgi:diguanylate cyclase (GGDEF)-like protein/PAS domain S-box-containing protein
MAVQSLFRSLGNRNSGSTDTGNRSGDTGVIGITDAKRRLELLDDFERAAMGWFWASDQEGLLTYMSASAVDQLGLSLEDVLGRPLVALFEADPDDPDQKSDRPFKFQLSSRNKINELTVRIVGKRTSSTGQKIWWSLSGLPKFDENGEFAGYRGAVKDISIDYERKLVDSRLAEFDSLTGLANRHRMNKRLDSTLGAYKAAKRSCALLMLDLDRFKQVNDTMGHQAGDEVLRKAAERIRQVIGDRGEVGRLGGDEFQVMIPDCDDRGQLGELAEKIINLVSQPYPIDGKQAIIGTSVGIAIAPYDGLEREDLVHSADMALYASKNGGRGQFRFYTADMKDESEEREILMEDLREALNNDKLELNYQPVVRIEDNMVVGMEALMRWEHAERGFVSPAVFIPAAEESNLINILGAWALHRACRDATAWPEAVRVAVNVSVLQFTNADFPSVVMSALEESGLDPSRLELELTESVFMGDSETTEQTFKTLKDLGVRLALDDFGTGYSSLSYLRSAPFDKIKVDKSFVDSCTQKDQNSAKIIAAIIGLSNALGMETTVEGVEAFDQLALVKSKGALYIQGWIYSKALQQEAILERIGSGEFKIEPDGPELFRSERRTVFRRIGVIHDDHRYEAVMRDLSKTGTRLEGLVGVPLGTELVLDLGAGQLVMGKVMRSQESMVGVEFETALISDGAGGLCTRHRVSPYALAAAGMPLAALSGRDHPSLPDSGGPKSKPQFLEVAITGPR